MWKCRHCNYVFKWVHVLNYHLFEFHAEADDKAAPPPKFGDGRC